MRGTGEQDAASGRPGARALLAALVCAAVLLPAASAGALVIGAPDLSGEPAGTEGCGAGACTITGEEPGAGHPFQAPENGRITEVRFRTPEGHASAGVRLLHALEFPNFLFGGFFPLGEVAAPPFGEPVTVVKTDIPVVKTEILALELSGPGQALDYYTLKGATRAAYEPALEEDQVGPPNQGAKEQIPGVQFEFEMVKPPLPEEEGKPPPPPPPSADVKVTKTFTNEFGFAQIGGTASFYVQVENRGPDTAKGVVLRDRFGRGLRFDRAKVLKGSAGKPKCGAAGKGATAVVCRLGALAPKAKVGIDFFFDVRGRSSKGAGKGAKRREKNVARVSSTGPPDPNKKNNVARARARIESGGAGCPERAKVGTRRNDRLKGTGRAETLFGRAGNDRIQGKRGRDCLFGEDGADVLIGGPDPDYIEGGDGNDRVFAADGVPDTIDCNGGKRDRVVADRSDRVARNCERVRRR